MSLSQGSTPSIVDRVRATDAGAPVVAASFLGGAAVFALAEESLLFAFPDGAEQRTAVHSGGILAVAADGERIVTGGDDGRVAVTNAKGDTTEIAQDAQRRWIDHVCAGPHGAVAWSAGKSLFVRRADEQRALDLPSSAGGIAFAPKGFRVAVAHYNGVTLWFPNASAPPERLEWRGSHLGVTFSPDGKFLVTTMQEPTLHGWRLADAKHMRMSGYAAKVRSTSWTADGDWLATSGADQLILWPFQGKDGPMGKAPKAVAPRDQRVVSVACHPKQEIAAIGYADGLILLARLSDGAEVLARAPGGGAVTALAWSARGDGLAFGTEEGAAGTLVL